MLLCHMLLHQKVLTSGKKVQTFVTSKIDVELEYLKIEYIAQRWLFANLAFSECSAWTYGLNKLSGGGAGM